MKKNALSVTLQQIIANATLQTLLSPAVVVIEMQHRLRLHGVGGSYTTGGETTSDAVVLSCDVL